MHFKRFPIEELPTDPEELTTWVRGLWDKKEERLAKFYSSENPSLADEGASALDLSEETSRTRIGMCLSLLFWGALLLVSFYQCYACSWVRLWVVFGTVLQLCMAFVDGMDGLQLMLHHRSKVE